MSTWYAPHCLTCKDTNYGSHGYDYRQYEIEEMIAALPQIIAIVKIAKGMKDFAVKFENSGCRDLPNHDWFLAHEGHDIRWINGYSEIGGVCNKRVKCGACDADHKCKLAAGHDGLCSVRGIQ